MTQKKTAPRTIYILLILSVYIANMLYICNIKISSLDNEVFRTVQVARETRLENREDGKTSHVCSPGQTKRETDTGWKAPE